MAAWGRPLGRTRQALPWVRSTAFNKAHGKLALITVFPLIRCRFLLTEKGQEFVNSIQLRVSGRNTAVSQAVQDIRKQRVCRCHNCFCWFRSLKKLPLCISEFKSSEWIFSSNNGYTHTQRYTQIHPDNFSLSAKLLRASKTIEMSLKSSILRLTSSKGFFFGLFLILVFVLLVLQKMTQRNCCKNCSVRKCAKYAWPKIFALSSSRVGTWLPARSVRNHSSVVRSAAEA